MTTEAARRGLLIAIEGIDGTGKSTQIRLLAEALGRRGLPVVATFEPTDGPYGRRIRELFVNRQAATPEEELDLFMADRRQHVAEVIGPALAEGRIVVTDRYFLSTAAYQGANGHDPETIMADNEAFAPIPDLVLLLTMPVAESLRRIRHGRGEELNDFEEEAALARVAAIFSAIRRDYIVPIDATRSASDVHQAIMARVEALLRRWPGSAIGRRQEVKT